MSIPPSELVRDLIGSPALPYFPEEPLKQRSLIFASTVDNRTYRLVENDLTEDGDNFTAWWVSPTLSNRPSGTALTLRTLVLKYSAEEDTSIIVDASGDGGETWSESIEFNLLQTVKQQRKIRRAFNTTGDDLRIRIRFNREIPVKVFSYMPSLVERGRLVV